MSITVLKTELQSAGRGLIDNDDLLRAILAGSDDCIKILDLSGRLQFMSEGGKRVMEVEDFGSLKGCPWPDFWEDSGHFDAKNAVKSAREGRAARFTGAAKTAKGTPRYWDVQVAPIMGADGKPAHLISISRDITVEHQALLDLKDAVARQKLLTDELNHRIKNTLAVVGAIAEQTIRGDDVAAARNAFTARLVTLSHAHDVLTQTGWVSASIRQVIDGALAPHRTAANQIRVDGPDLMLPPKPALSLALAINELATNAIKYGALSVDAGSLNVSWSVREDLFEFRWTETGGPPVTDVPKRRGFGSRLINSVLAHDFAGDVRTRFEPDGVVCELRSPLPHLTVDPA